jgi:hypothetical protein
MRQTTVQAKLMVGAADDSYEREADAVADTVMRSPSEAHAEPPNAVSGHSPIQQTRANLTGLDASQSFAVDGQFERELALQQRGGAPLPGAFRAKMEPRFGASFAGVRVHADAAADRLNRSVNAKAFTAGSHIYFRQGAYSPGNTAGNRLIAHELTHTLQQTGGQPLQRSAGEGSAGGVRSGLKIRRTKFSRIQRVLYQDVVNRFQSGDLMYGLNMARVDTQAPVKAKMRALDLTGNNKQQAASVLDELNNFFIGTSGYNEQDVSKYGVAYGTQKAGYNPDPQVQTQATAFRHFLETDPAYRDTFTGVAQARGVAITDRLRTWERIKQVCKAGLAYTTAQQGKHIFFMLDGLNMADVVNKRQYNKNDDPGFDATQDVHQPSGDSRQDITSAELRFLYRNRTNHAIIDNVSFWKDGKESQAPWLTRPALWQHYENQRQNVADDTPKAKVAAAQPQGTDNTINAIRTGVLDNMAARKFAYAAKSAIDLGVTFEPTSFFSRAKVTKKIMNLGTLDTLREQAKAINASDTDANRENAIAALAARASQATNPANKWFFKDNMLTLLRKVAFYLYRRLPNDHIATGAVFHAQKGVTGISKRSASPTALLMMGIGESDKRGVIQHLVRDPQNWVHADPGTFVRAMPEYRESAGRGNPQVSSEMEKTGQGISKDAANRAIEHHRNVIYNGTGDSLDDYKAFIKKLKATDYRIKLVLVHTPVHGGQAQLGARAQAIPDANYNKAAGKVAWNFQALHTKADEAFIYRPGSPPNVEWKLGHGGTPVEKYKNLDQQTAQPGGERMVTPPHSASFSAKPDFEKAAIGFEEKLGVYAFNHPKAQDAVRRMTARIVMYMNLREKFYQRAAKRDTEFTKQFNPKESWERIGEMNTRFAGAVGKEMNAVKAAVTAGNVRERMTHIHNFMDNVLGKDLINDDYEAEVDKLIQRSGMNLAKLQKRRNALGDKEKVTEKTPSAYTFLAERDKIRYKSPGSGASERQANEVPGLSAAEKAHMGVNKPDDKVQWNEGVKAWFVNELHDWVKINRQTGLPLAAGPSAHTNAFMRAAKYLNVNKPYDVRLAIIGHLIPIHAHSLIEIMDVAEVYGASYTYGRNMYHDIKPLTEQELRDNVAEGKLFPDEIAP